MQLPPLPKLPAMPALPAVARGTDLDAKLTPIAAGDGAPLRAQDAGARVSGSAGDGCVQVTCTHDFPPRAVRALMLSAGVPFLGGHECLTPKFGLLVVHVSVSRPNESIYRWRV